MMDMPMQAAQDVGTHYEPEARVHEAKARLSLYDRELAQARVRVDQLETLMRMERASIEVFENTPKAMPSPSVSY